jgi:O-antigen/teichoic acid export membrane protein
VNNRIVRQFIALAIGQVAGTGLGYLFWVLSAREFKTDQVGIAAAAINTFGTIGTISLLGFGTFLIRELPAQDAPRRLYLVRACIACVGAAGAVISVLVWLAAPLTGHALRDALDDPRIVPVFLLGAVATAVALLLDQASLGLDRSRAQAVRNTIAAALRFPIVFGLMLTGVREAWVLVIAWVLPLAASDVVLFRTLPLARSARSAADHVAALVRTHAREAMRNHVLNMCIVAGPLLLPVVAALTLHARQNAEFTMAWLMATFVFLAPYLLAISLFAATASQGLAEFTRNARRTLPAGLALSATLILAAWLLGPWALHIMGKDYAAHSARLLDVLALAGLWAVVRDHLVARARVTGRLGAAARWMGVAVVLEVGAATTGAVLGGDRGLALAWVSAQALEMMLTAPTAVRLLRTTPANPQNDSPESMRVAEVR